MFLFQGFFAFSLFHLIAAFFLRFLASVCEAQLRICVNSSNEPEKAVCFKQHYEHKITFQKFSSAMSCIFLRCKIYTLFGFMPSKLLHAK